MPRRKNGSSHPRTPSSSAESELKAADPSASGGQDQPLPCGIYKLEWVDASTLCDNPNNWRVHPAEQHRALQASLAMNGWAGALLYNETTGRLIDGHLRKELATRSNKPVPVLFGRWTEEQERNLLLTLDPIAAMAESNHEIFSRLSSAAREEMERVKERYQDLPIDDLSDVVDAMESLSSSADDVGCKSLLDAGRSISEYWKQPDTSKPYPYGDEPDPVASKAASLPEIWMFEMGKCPYDIPQLMPGHLLASCPTPIRTWTPACKNKHDYTGYYLWCCTSNDLPSLSNCVVCCHSEDSALEYIWSDNKTYAAYYLQRGAYAVISPEFSVIDHTPQAVSIYNIYRNRWLGRYFQECGIPVIPSVPHPSKQAGPELVCAGIPHSPPCISMQVRVVDRSLKSQASFAAGIRVGIVKVINYLKPDSLIIYGGDIVPRLIELIDPPKGLQIIPILDYITERRVELEGPSGPVKPGKKRKEKEPSQSAG